MAIYHLSMQVIKRSEGRSSVACAAYRSGQKLHDGRLGETFSYKRKDRVHYEEILLPKNAPKKYKNRETLWNDVEQSEKRKDAQLCREVDVALPVELSKEEQIKLARNFVKGLTRSGMVVDICLHNLGTSNPHFHAMFTMRDVGPEGFKQKNRKWNSKEFIETVRKGWGDLCNQALEQNQIQSRIDHRSLEKQGITTAPQIHHGNKPKRMERNEQIKKNNSLIKTLKQQLNKLREMLPFARYNDKVKKAKNEEDRYLEDLVLKAQREREEEQLTLEQKQQQQKNNGLQLKPT